MNFARRVMACLAAVLGLLIISTGTAQAAPVSMQITDAVMDLGGLKGVKAIDSSVPDPPASMTGDLTGSTVNIPKAGFVFPPKEAEVTTGITATINMEANEDITGTFDAATGRLDLDANLKATVEVLGSTCVISPIELSLSSSNGRPYLGVPYTAGLEGNGAVDAAWTALPPVTGGGACGTVESLIAGPGGIWLSNGLSTPQVCTDQPDHPGCGDDSLLPTVAPKLTATPPASTADTSASFSFAKGDGEPAAITGFQCSLDSGAFEACDNGSKSYTGLAAGSHTFQVKATNAVGEGPAAVYSWTITSPGKAKLGALKVTPKAKAVKRGKKATVKVRVRNAGKAGATGVKVCVTAPKKFVKVKKCVKVGALGAGKAKVAKFKVTVKKKAKKGKKAVLKFKATGKGVAAKKGKATIKIK